jgi:hypothetical protein
MATVYTWDMRGGPTVLKQIYKCYKVIAAHENGKELSYSAHANGMNECRL